jgi:uncharacterized membrane protein YfcA
MVGFSGATISFTAWNLVLPFLLKFFGVELFPALFVSVVLDLVNAIVLTIFYGYHNKVSFASGFLFSLISAPVALISSVLTTELLLKYKYLLEGGIGIFPFILSVVFCIRGTIIAVKDYKAKKMKLAKEAHDHGTDIHIHDQRELDEIDDGTNAETTITYNNSQNVDSEAEKHFDKTADVVTDSIADEESNRETADLNVHTESTTNTAVVYDWKYYLTQKFAVEEGFGNGMIFSKDFNPKQKAIYGTITGVIVAIVGVMSGMVYVGGGMILNVAFAACWRVDQKIATATGCFSTVLPMLILAMTLVDGEGVFTTQTSYFLVVGIPCCIVGAIIGAFLSLRISNMATFFIISAVLMILGIVITIQGQL